MGKATFVRYVAVLPVRYVVVALPCAGGVLFLLGSFCFWPGSGEAATTVGAACFLVGSLCYWAAPLLLVLEIESERRVCLTGAKRHNDQRTHLFF